MAESDRARKWHPAKVGALHWRAQALYHGNLGGVYAEPLRGRNRAPVRFITWLGAAIACAWLNLRGRR